MTFERTPIEGVVVVGIEPIEDDRGFFARAWCMREFAGQGFGLHFVQENVGFSAQEGTLRGMHFQRAPFDEAKLVRCTAGSVWDVAVDLRPNSPTRNGWYGVELTASKHNMLYIPEGCAHGYLTLGSGAEVRYLTSQFYEREAASGVRFDDPALGIEWPGEPRVVSDQDRSWPLLVQEAS